MHSVLTRGNALLAYTLSVLAGLTFCCFLSTVFIDYRTNADIQTVQVVVKNMPNFNTKEEGDLGYIKFDLKTDLTSIFNWNVKQLFLYLTAEYSTPTNEFNQVVLWDKIIQRGENAVIDYKNINPKYYFWDDGKGLKAFQCIKASSYIIGKMSQIPESIFNYLCRQTPCFPVPANSIHIIHEPAIFYNTLLQKCANAKKRITLASLYLGTGQLEEQLVGAIRKRLLDSQHPIQVKILLDYCRSSRGTPNSRTMLKDLVQEHPQNFQVALYHTPKLRGLSRLWLPHRYNELIGLQHMKLFIIDDTLIISGHCVYLKRGMKVTHVACKKRYLFRRTFFRKYQRANLSNDYFTNRQDRYIMFENCPDVANFYEELVSRVCAFSLQLEINDKNEENLILSESWPENCHPYKSPRHSFVTRAHDSIKTVIDTSLERNKPTTEESMKGADTWVFPLIQMGQLNIQQDSTVLATVVSALGTESVMNIASGYFNVTDSLATNILTSRACFNILVAHPSANGFLSAKGPAGGIPAVYTHIAKEFIEKVHSLGQKEYICLLEFVRPGWTYHAKGMWLSHAGENKPFLTYVGSSNLGYRSLKRDLEAQAIVFTRNEDLQRRLAEERDRLFDLGQPFPFPRIPKDRRTTVWIKFCADVFRTLF